MKKKIPYIITCVQCPAHHYFEGKPQCLHKIRYLKQEEEIIIPDWCPLPNLETKHPLTELIENQQDMPPGFNKAVDKMLDDEIAS